MRSVSLETSSTYIWQWLCELRPELAGQFSCADLHAVDKYFPSPLVKEVLSNDLGEMYSSPHQVQYTKGGSPCRPKHKIETRKKFIIDTDRKASNTYIYNKNHINANNPNVMQFIDGLQK